MIPPYSLTVRELRVVMLMASGLSVREAARTLRIDFAATAHHHESAMRKLRVTNAVGLKRAAIRLGLIGE